MADIRNSQSFTLVAEGAPSDVRSSQLYSLVAVKYPAEFVQSSQAYIQVAARTDNTMKVAQAFTLVAVRGRIADTKVRAWTYTLDGHDYYVLRLGDAETLVYDLYSQQWSVFGNADSFHWRAVQGRNWLGSGTYSGGYGSNVIVGDEQNGSLYFLDPTYPFDDDLITGEGGRVAFRCRAMAEVLVEGTAYVSCPTVRLGASFGQAHEEASTNVELEYSDDQGATYVSAGTISVTQGDYNPRIEWLSLGSMSDPGRLFRIVDYGAVSRLDSLQTI